MLQELLARHFFAEQCVNLVFDHFITFFVFNNYVFIQLLYICLFLFATANRLIHWKLIMVLQKYKKLTRFVAGAFAALILSFSSVPVFAAEYNCGAYGRGTYDSGQVCAATTDGGGGGLANTGEKVLPFVIPAVLILAGTALLFRSRRRMKQRRSLQQ